MDTSRWQSIRGIFHACLERAPSERRAFLARECRGNDALRAEVERLLKGVDETDRFLEPPSSAIDRIALSVAPAATAPPGTRFGRYVVRGVLGVGGMGVVYEAEQDNPRRTVALKLIRPGVAAADALRRFEHEAQVLGRLQHRGIAQIYEAGATGSDHERQPFFAMELVRGESITRFAERRGLGIRDRLRLLAEVCDAVEHAHQKGVIHRDLKPGNILVDDSGQPRVLDFGVARVMDSGVASATITADVSQIVGTLAYMSPEQAAGSPLDLDTRSDVYSLGLICHELLAGRPPFALSGKPIAEAARIIREQSPTPLGLLNRALRGDIETIVARAIERDRARRYQSAAALRDDIQRFLRNEPIQARPPTRAYRLRKFVARNRALVLGTAAVFAALVLGLLGTTWQAYRATQSEARARQFAERESAARRAAETEAQRALRTREFLEDVLVSATPDRGRGAGFTVREVLDLAAPRIDAEFADFPETRAELHATVGEAYSSLGLNAEAEKHLRACLALRESLLGEGHADLLPTLRRLAPVLRRLARYEDSEAVLLRAQQIAAREFGEDSVQMAGVLNSLGLVRLKLGDVSGAEQLLRRSMQLKQAGGSDTDALGTGMVNLGLALRGDERLPEAEAAIRDGLKLLGPDDRSGNAALRTNALNNLASILESQRRFAEALPILEDVHARQKRAVGEAAPRVTASRVRIAACLDALGQRERARELCRQAHGELGSVVIDEHPAILPTFRQLGELLARFGETQAAESLLRRCLEESVRVHGPKSRESAAAGVALARFLTDAQRHVEAEPLLRQAVEAGETRPAQEQWRTAEHLRLWGSCLESLGRAEEAEQKLLAAHAALRERFGEAHGRTARALRGLIAFYERAGRLDDADRLRQAAPDRAATDDVEPASSAEDP